VSPPEETQSQSRSGLSVWTEEVGLSEANASSLVRIPECSHGNGQSWQVFLDSNLAEVVAGSHNPPLFINSQPGTLFTECPTDQNNFKHCDDYNLAESFYY
jgi:hypothetical protein